MSASSPPPSGSLTAVAAVVPHDPEAERSVLGAVFVDPASLLHLVERLKVDDFYVESHRLIYQTCLLLQTHGEPADAVTVTNRLREEGTLARVGGVSYLQSLVDALPDVGNVVHYAAIVHDKAVKRRLLTAAQRIVSECSADRGSAAEVVESAQRDVFRIAEDTLAGGLVHIGQLTATEIEHLKAAQGTKAMLTGVPSGFYLLDQKTSGLQRKDLIILAARPSMGKTSLAVNICCNAAIRRGHKVAIFSLEMSSEQLVRRMLSSEARIDQKRLTDGYLAKTDWPRLTMAAQSLQEVSIWIDDSAGLSVLELSAKARRLKQEKGVDLIMVDYLQLMSGGGRFGSRNEEVSAISRGLKGVAKDLDVPLLVLSQLSRQPERRGGDHRPQLSDLRDSGSIEQDADVVMFITRPSRYDSSADERAAELIIAKQRNGPIGEIPLVFQHEYTRFENLESGRDESEQPF